MIKKGKVKLGRNQRQFKIMDDSYGNGIEGNELLFSKDDLLHRF